MTTRTSEAVTRGVRVHVEARYSAEHSQPALHKWFFLYTVRISNEGDRSVRLVNRHWIITDANGEVEEVRGPGVVGRQPLLAPGEHFEFTSGCPLGTSFGSMHGSYEMHDEQGGIFEAEIAGFALSDAVASN